MTPSEEWSGPVADAGEPLPVEARASRFPGAIWEVVSDEVAFPSATVRRDVVLHPGAVVVIALDDDERVLLIRQYRHPVGRYLFEPPAGLLDVAGEPPWQTARRELAEEAGYEAAEWWVLLDTYLSPGGTSEAIRIYLARGLVELPEGRQHTGEAEEAHLPRAWVDLDDAKDLVLAGALGSPSANLGILAAWAGRAGDWSALRPADAPWPARDHLIATDRLPSGTGHP
ncbi:MAG: NUDIX domain-containing protein [Actinomycetales bacterium]|nr:NUDIX domain-containing protein [Actinomycetales bacterium]